MPVIINHKICDQASACGGISVCPVGAFTYNKAKKQIEVDNEKCISCGACEKTCPIGAIGFAKTKEEFAELVQAVELDPRSPEDLFVDRFGGDVVNKNVLINFNDINKVVKQNKLAIIELFNDDSIMCLLKSITYKEIALNTKYKTYYRCNVEGNNLSVFGVTELPSMLLVENGKIKKVISGYYEESNKTKLFKLMK